jgi:hypothetical protein
MRNIKIAIIMLHIGAIMLMSCSDIRPLETTEVPDLEFHLKKIQDKVVKPMQERLMQHDISELKRLYSEWQLKEREADSTTDYYPTEEELTMLREQVELYISPSELSYLNYTATTILSMYPQLADMDYFQIHEFLMNNVTSYFSVKYLDDKSFNGTIFGCGAAAAEMALTLAAIEITWISAMIACVGSFVGYPLCSGAVTAVKYLAVAALMFKFGDCLVHHA